MTRVFIATQFFTAFMFLTVISSSVSANVFRSPTLSTGDIISVEVENEPELNVKQLTISDWGTVNLPLIGDVQLKWKSPDAAQTLIKDLYYKDYLKKPVITLTVNQYRPFFIDGNVNAPGSFKYTEGLTVSAALEQAGGLIDNTNPPSITLLVETSISGPVPASLDDTVMPGDVITVK